MTWDVPALWAMCLVAIVGLGGCLGLDSENKTEPPDPASGISVYAAQTLALETCRGTVMRGFVPAPWADPFLPPGFEARPFGVGAYDVAVTLRACDRAIIGRVAVQDFRIFEAGIVAVQSIDDNSSSATLVLVESFVSSEPVAEAMAALGVDSKVAQFQVTAGISAGAIANKDWVVTADSARFEFHEPLFWEANAVARSEGSHWYPGPPHMRRDYVIEETIPMTAEPVAIQMEGASRVNALFGHSAAWELVSQARRDSGYTYTFVGGFGE